MPDAEINSRSGFPTVKFSRFHALVRNAVMPE